MASLVVLERQLWLTRLEIKDVDKVLDSPVSPTGLFRLVLEGFAERFNASQNSSQVLQHFLPKCFRSAAASSPPRRHDSAALEARTSSTISLNPIIAPAQPDTTRSLNVREPGPR